MYNLNNEVWLPITDYPNYMISNLGNVKSLSNNKTRKEKILKNVKNRGGYLQVFLSKNGKVKRYYIHRLVAEHFLPNLDYKPEIDHINTNKSDNRVENLRWCSHKENINNLLTKDKMSKNKLGIEHPNSKPILQFTLDKKLVRKWNCATDVERELGIYQTNISKCCKGKYKSAGGFKWQYAN